MAKAIIKLAYRQVINASSKGRFEEEVFRDSYSEFLLQSQAYNRENRFTSLEEMMRDNPKANSLHYKVGFAIGLYVKELNGRIPVLQDSSGNPVCFALHQFELVHSDIKSKASHIVAISYLTANMVLLDVFGDYMLLAFEEDTKGKSIEGVKTFLIKIQSGLTITHYKAETGAS